MCILKARCLQFETATTASLSNCHDYNSSSSSSRREEENDNTEELLLNKPFLEQLLSNAALYPGLENHISWWDRIVLQTSHD